MLLKLLPAERRRGNASFPPLCCRRVHRAAASAAAANRETRAAAAALVKVRFSWQRKQQDVKCSLCRYPMPPLSPTEKENSLCYNWKRNESGALVFAVAASSFAYTAAKGGLRRRIRCSSSSSKLPSAAATTRLCLLKKRISLNRERSCSCQRYHRTNCICSSVECRTRGRYVCEKTCCFFSRKI